METPKKVTFRALERKSKSDLLNSVKKDINTPTRSKAKVSFCSSEEARKITVAIRFRPLNPKESKFGTNTSYDVRDKEVMVNTSYSNDGISGLVTTFSYDFVFSSINEEDAKLNSQKCVFEEIGIPLLDAALQGYNACLFAYGQTGSGKTYSMMGCDNSLCGDGAGVIPRFCTELINRNVKRTHIFSLSYYEIYNEKIHDLLSASCDVDNKTSLKVREHPIHGPYVENLTKHNIELLNDVNTLLVLGNSRRATSSTFHNNYSSRSHAILEICISSNLKDKSVVSKVSLVDLAGSERMSHSNITEERFKEGLSINKSLLTLGKVITSLSDQKKGNFIPYRESVLTWLLKESLGGNSRTVMLATVSPSIISLEESLSTLRYACQARSILNRVAVNEDPQLKIIRELREEVERLKSLKDHTKNEKNKFERGKDHSKFIATAEYIKYENELLNIEVAQKTVQERLQTELSRMVLHLEAAEKRGDELESQKKEYFHQITNNCVSPYQTDFYENLQDILNTSSSDVTHYSVADDNEMFKNLKKLNHQLEKMKMLCLSRKENNPNIKRVLPLVEHMKKCHQDICEIMSLNH